jgi:hypothetical protein
MRAKPSREGLSQRGQLLPQLAACEVGEHRRIRRPGDQRPSMARPETPSTSFATKATVRRWL